MTINISLKQVRAFVQVAVCGNYAEAAEQLHVSQPALSIAVRNLEQLIGGQLFSRSTRNVALTPEGQAFLPVARRLLHDWEEACTDLNNLFSLKRGKLTLAVMPAFASSYLPLLLKDFHSHHADIAISVQDVVMESVMSAVVNSRAELGITFEADALEGLEFIPLFEDDFVVICTPEHPLAGENVVSWLQAQAFPFVMMNRGSSVRHWLDDACNQQNIVLNTVLEASQLVTIGQMVAADLGIAVVPALCKEQMQDRGLCCIPMKDSGLKRAVGLIKRLRGPLSAAASEFLERAVSYEFRSR